MRGAADGVHVLMYLRGARSTSHEFACLCTTPKGTCLHVFGRPRAGPESAWPSRRMMMKKYRKGLRTKSCGWRVRSDDLPHRRGIYSCVSVTEVWMVSMVIRQQHLLVTCKHLATAREPTKEKVDRVSMSDSIFVRCTGPGHGL
jgi:hypothetical protein